MENTHQEESLYKVMTFLDYIDQNGEAYRQEYYDYCREENIEPDSEDSAIAFIEYREGTLEEAMDY